MAPSALPTSTVVLGNKAKAAPAAATPANSCTATSQNIDSRAIRVKVSVRPRAMVTAGLANPVDGLARTIAATHAPTAAATVLPRPERTSPSTKHQP